MSGYWDDPDGQRAPELVTYQYSTSADDPAVPGGTADEASGVARSSSTHRDNRPEYPSAPLLIATAIVVAFSALLLLMDGSWWHIVGYLLGTVLTIGLVTVYRRDDLAKRSRSAYVARPVLSAIAVGLIVAGFLIAMAHVWALANDWAR